MKNENHGGGEGATGNAGLPAIQLLNDAPEPAGGLMSRNNSQYNNSDYGLHLYITVDNSKCKPYVNMKDMNDLHLKLSDALDNIKWMKMIRWN